MSQEKRLSKGEKRSERTIETAHILSFDTEVGAHYQVLFDIAGNPDDPGLKMLLVTGNSTVTEYDFDNTGKSADAMGWIEKSFLFQADGVSTTLQFASENLDSPYGPAIDNVCVFKIGPCIEEDLRHPTGAVHAHDNLLWLPNNKLVPVTIEGYVLDELSMMRDGEGIGVSKAYIFVNGEMIILRNDTTDLLASDGSFSLVKELRATKSAKYVIELWAADTTAIEDGGPNEGLVDSTYVRVPHDMRGKDSQQNFNNKVKTEVIKTESKSKNKNNSKNK